MLRLFRQQMFGMNLRYKKPFYVKRGQLIEDADIIIGSTAIVNNMVMVTENIKHIGRLNGVVVENWTEKS